MRAPQLLLFLLPIAHQFAAASSAAMPLLFVANQGQAPELVRFMAKGSEMTAFFATDEVMLRVAGHGIRIQFEGATRNVRIEGRGLLPGRANFLIGSEKDWRVGVPVYGGVAYRGLYPGIDMIYGANGRQLKSEFVVQPGSDPSRVRVRYLGAGELHLDNGALVIQVGVNEIREQQPVVYQEAGEHRVLIEGRFVVNQDGSVGFSIGEYDHDRPLVIDPVLAYSTLLGGTGADAAQAIAVDSTGASYVTGYTDSYNFPTANPEQAFNAGGVDVFVAKISAAGNTLIYSTYLGGTADDRAYGIAVDSSGAAYVTGATTSTNFPVRNALQRTLLGGKNAFIVKLSPSGNSVAYSTYFGGNGSDTGNSIAVDASGSAYVVGDTTSLTLPANGFQRSNHGSQNAFVVKLGLVGGLVYCTYLGGSVTDHGAAIAVDTAGSAYVTGSTYSLDFPTMSPFQAYNGGGQDAFVSKLSANGGTLLYSTYLGGSGGGVGYLEGGQGIAVDAQGSAYIAGGTSSTNFPVLFPLQSRLNGWEDAFVAKFNAAGRLAYSTYLGGSGVDVANAIAVDTVGKMYIAGFTYSTDFPVVNAIQGRNAGDYDAFLAVLTAAGDGLLISDYLGGAAADTANALALDAGGSLYVAGLTQSTSFPLTNAYQVVNGGIYSAFVTKITVSQRPTVVSVTPSSGSGTSQTFTLVFSDSSGYQSLAAVEVILNAQVSVNASCYVYIAPSSGQVYLAGDDGGSWTWAMLRTGGTLQNSQCRVNASGSSSSGSGNNLTVSLAISFQPGFAGAKGIYMDALDGVTGYSGWQQKGSWTVSGGSPAPVSVTPSSGSGTSQTFTLVFSDSSGYQSLAAVEVILNAQVSVNNSCYVYIVPSSGQVYLASDDGGSWTWAVFRTGGTLQNSQCRVNASGSSSSGSGNNLTVSLAMSFQPGFAGAKNTYMDALDGATGYSGWQPKGSWTIP
jgi:hypothetical protein